jgi:hypothetical protein
MGRVWKELYPLNDSELNEECIRAGDSWIVELQKIEKANKQRWACIVHRLQELWSSET